MLPACIASQACAAFHAMKCACSEQQLADNAQDLCEPGR